MIVVFGLAGYFFYDSFQSATQSVTPVSVSSSENPVSTPTYDTDTRQDEFTQAYDAKVNELGAELDASVSRFAKLMGEPLVFSDTWHKESRAELDKWSAIHQSFQEITPSDSRSGRHAVLSEEFARIPAGSELLESGLTRRNHLTLMRALQDMQSVVNSIETLTSG